MIESTVVVAIVLLAAAGVGYGLYRSATGKSGCAGCRGCAGTDRCSGSPKTSRE